MNKISFDTKLFWVQLHNLPIHYMKHSYGELIGSSIGKIMDIDVDINDTGWGSLLHVWLELSLMKPLARGCKISITGEDSWIPVRYEKLSKFCFGCEQILHEEGGCIWKENSPKDQFGTWLMAEIQR